MVASPFDREDLHAPLAEINTTPLVDVMLVLMVIFLVTAPILTHAIKLELPHEAAGEVKAPKLITLSIKADGQYYWDERLITSDALEQNMHAIVAADSKQFIYIRADKNVIYGKVSHVLALATKLGLTNIGFVTEPN